VELKEQDQDELINILDCHFDPDKQPLKPEVNRNRRRSSRRRNSRNRNRSNNKENRKANKTPNSKPNAEVIPDSTSKTVVDKTADDGLVNTVVPQQLVDCGQQQSSAAAVA
jgi:hypothetical protein